MKVAIFGAGGAIGRTVLPLLLARGHAVRLVGRGAAKLASVRSDGVEIVAADLADPAAARRAADGVDAILYSVGLDYHLSAFYPPLIRTAIDAAQAAGVRRFLLVSTVYPYGRAQTPTVAETHPREPHTVRGHNRKAQADIVLAAHDPARMNTAVLVLPDFYGPTADKSVAREILESAVTGKTAAVIGPLDVPHEYVYVPDAARAIVELFDRPAAFGRTYHLGGAGTITSRQFIAAAERSAGARVKFLAVNQTILRLAGTFSPLMRGLADMYYLFTDPIVLDDSALRALLPDLRKTSYADGIAATIAALRSKREPIHA